MNDQKICTKCGNLKNISEFRNDSRLKSGKGSVCLDCTRKDSLDRRNKNKEKYRKAYKIWAQKNKEYNSLRKMGWAKKNPESKKASDKRNYEKNKEKVNKRSKQYREKNKERIKEIRRQWRVKNHSYVLAKNAFRRAAQLKRTPAWLTEEDKELIEKIYKECRRRSKETGIPHHVDHILPLLGETVSGLHVPLNLQIITAQENIRKKNRTINSTEERTNDDDSGKTEHL